MHTTREFICSQVGTNEIGSGWPFNMSIAAKGGREKMSSLSISTKFCGCTGSSQLSMYVSEDQILLGERGQKVTIVIVFSRPKKAGLATVMYVWSSRIIIAEYGSTR